MYYFEDVEKQEELKRVLEEWAGTPFRHHCGVKGLGCDCIHFVAHVFKELGLLRITKETIPDYAKDWHLHNTREVLEEGIFEKLNVKKIEINAPMNGDIICSHYGKAASHASIYFDGYVHQSLTKIGVCKIHFGDQGFKKRMKFAYRILS